MTNEDVIDLYNRVKIGTPVVVLAPGRATRRSIRAWRLATDQRLLIELSSWTGETAPVRSPAPFLFAS